MRRLSENLTTESSGGWGASRNVNTHNSELALVRLQLRGLLREQRSHMIEVVEAGRGHPSMWIGARCPHVHVPGVNAGMHAGWLLLMRATTVRPVIKKPVVPGRVVAASVCTPVRCLGCRAVDNWAIAIGCRSIRLLTRSAVKLIQVQLVKSSQE